MDKRPAPQRRSTRPTKAGPTLSLSLRRPDLARDWHPTKNGLLTLDQCAANNTHPVWWQCHQNPHHVWRASVKSRYSKRTGCRRCTLAVRAWNNESFHTRTLSRKSPELAATWHPTKNGTLTPNSVTFNSRQRVWWQCPSNPTHVWDTTVNNRQRSNCPFCAGRFHRAIDARHRWQDPISVAHRELMRHASHVIKSYMAVHRNVAAELQAVIHGLTADGPSDCHGLLRLCRHRTVGLRTLESQYPDDARVRPFYRRLPAHDHLAESAGA